MPKEIQDVPIITETSNEELDLLAEMRKATEYKPSPLEAEKIISESIIDENNNENDFDPPPAGEADAENEDAKIDASELTDLIIDGGDMLLEGVMPYLYKQTIEKEDVKILNEITRVYRNAKETKAKVIEFNQEQQRVMNVYLDYEDYTKNLPLTPKEKKNLRAPLKKLLSNIDFKVSPTNTLLAVVFMIMLPRLIPVLARYFFTDKPKKENE